MTAERDKLEASLKQEREVAQRDVPDMQEFYKEWTTQLPGGVKVARACTHIYWRTKCTRAFSTWWNEAKRITVRMAELAALPEEAALIQRCFSLTLARMTAKKLRRALVLRRDRAVRVLQRAVRALIFRRRFDLHRAKLRRAVEDAAVRQLQRVWRGFSLGRCAARLKRCTLLRHALQANGNGSAALALGRLEEDFRVRPVCRSLEIERNLLLLRLREREQEAQEGERARPKRRDRKGYGKHERGNSGGAHHDSSEEAQAERGDSSSSSSDQGSGGFLFFHYRYLLQEEEVTEEGHGDVGLSRRDQKQQPHLPSVIALAATTPMAEAAQAVVALRAEALKKGNEALFAITGTELLALATSPHKGPLRQLPLQALTKHWTSALVAWKALKRSEANEARKTWVKEMAESQSMAKEERACVGTWALFALATREADQTRQKDREAEEREKAHDARRLLWRVQEEASKLREVEVRKEEAERQGFRLEEASQRKHAAELKARLEVGNRVRAEQQRAKREALRAQVAATEAKQAKARRKKAEAVRKAAGYSSAVASGAEAHREKRNPAGIGAI
jgi:hypothetical protein